jgi:hypothetical protein
MPRLAPRSPSLSPPLSSSRSSRSSLPLAALLLAAAVTWLSPSSARAAERGRWYGWQLALADAAALTLTLAPVDSDWRGATVAVGMTSVFTNGSTVGMVHRNPKGASLSLLRLPLFLGGRLVGFVLGNLLCQEIGCKGPMLTAGSGFGLGVAMAIDHLYAFEPAPGLAWAPAGDAPPPPRIFAPPARRRPGVAPGYTVALPLYGRQF